jgi:hypothetical protein
VLARLGVTGSAPSEKTIRRVLQCVDADGLNASLGTWMWLRTKVFGGLTVISFDGKTLKSDRDAAGHCCEHGVSLSFNLCGMVVARRVSMLVDCLRS